MRTWGVVVAMAASVTACGPDSPEQPTRATGTPAPTPQAAATVDPVAPGDWPLINRTLAANRYSPLTEINAANVSTLASCLDVSARRTTRRRCRSSSAASCSCRAATGSSRSTATRAPKSGPTCCPRHPLPRLQRRAAPRGPGGGAPTVSTRGVSYWPGDGTLAAAHPVHEPRELDRDRRRDRRSGRRLRHRRRWSTSACLRRHAHGLPTTSRSSARRAARCRKAHPAIRARSTCARARSSGSSRPCRAPASRSTTPGATAGKTAAAPTCGRSRRPSTPSAASRICRSQVPPRTTTAAIARATTCSPTRSSRSKRRTGKYVWHFQTVHHDLWDIDMPTRRQPVRLRAATATRIPAIAHVGKSSYFYVLDRTTGKPLIDVEEQPVPKGDVPTE